MHAVNNPFVAKMQRAGATRSIGRGLASDSSHSGVTLVAYAAKEGTVAADGEGRNSPYTTALLTHLEEPGLDVGLMFRKVRDAVLAKTGGHQEPFWYGSLSSEGAYLAALPEPEEPTPIVQHGPDDPKPGPVSPGNDRRLTAEELAAERVFWESVKDSTHAADFEAYLEQFPGGTYEALARNRLRRLTGKQEEKPVIQVAVTPDKSARVVPSQPAAPMPEAVEASLELKREERRQIQMGLASLGLDPGPVDGLFGRRTRTAIRNWQSSQGGNATGHLDAEAAKVLLAAGEKEARKRAAMRPGQVFRDCPECPEMVVVPAGSFMMGSTHSNERPVHRVTIPVPFAVGKYEVTRGDFKEFIEATGRASGNSGWTQEYDQRKERAERGWNNPGYSQGDRHPVVCVSWNDARAYVRWFSRKTGKRYRLLSEAEWEYAARASTGTSRYWGDDMSTQCDHANGFDRTAKAELDFDWEHAPCRDGSAYTARVGRYGENSFGLSDMLGNVWEWVEDCWRDNYAGAPADGDSWVSAGDCGERVLRGGSWVTVPGNLRTAFRAGYSAEDRNYNIGFRISRTLSP